MSKRTQILTIVLAGWLLALPSTFIVRTTSDAFSLYAVASRLAFALGYGLPAIIIGLVAYFGGRSRRANIMAIALITVAVVDGFLFYAKLHNTRADIAASQSAQI